MTYCYCCNCDLTARLCFRVEFSPGGKFSAFASKIGDFIVFLEEHELELAVFIERKDSMNATLRSEGGPSCDLHQLTVNSTEKIKWVRTANRLQLWTIPASCAIKGPYTRLFAYLKCNLVYLIRI